MEVSGGDFSEQAGYIEGGVGFHLPAPVPPLDTAGRIEQDHTRTSGALTFAHHDRLALGICTLDTNAVVGLGLAGVRLDDLRRVRDSWCSFLSGRSC